MRQQALAQVSMTQRLNRVLAFDASIRLNYAQLGGGKFLIKYLLTKENFPAFFIIVTRSRRLPSSLSSEGSCGLYVLQADERYDNNCGDLLKGK
jgi:hypothetical protein